MLLLWFMGFFTFVVVVHGQHQHASNIKVITRSRCFGIVPPHMKLECTDPKHFMRVISAVYGLSSDTACGDLCCPQVNDCQVPVNMSRPETHNQIFGQCSGQQECIVLVEQASLWSAPCGRGKYSNYLQVKYECVKAEITTQSNCYGEPSGTMHLYCEKGTFINIKDAVYGRSNRTPCARRCCPAETDCVEKLLEKTPPLYTAILGQCLGRAECTIPVDKISGMCGNQFHVSTYVNVTYECVPVSIVNEVCMEGNNAIDVGYIQSEGYPAEVPGNNLRSCECRLSTAKNSSITIRAVDINMYSGPGCREHQELAMFTKTDQAAYSCQHITDTILYNGPANELNMKFVNTLFSNEGKFWLEYSASWGTVTVNCTSAISITTTTTLTPPVTQPMVKVDPGSSIRSILIVPDPNTKGGDTGDQSQEEPWRYQSRCFGKSPPHMELTCSEPKTFIKIQAAVYGLNTNDRCNDICCPSNNDCQVHVNASRPESYKQIVDQCSGQTHCIVLVEQGELWTAECGRGKYSNYLMVAYQCVKAKVTTISKCYGEYPPEMNLFCDIGTYIHIRDAIFGRSDYKPCPRRCCPREDDCAEKVRTRNPGLYTAILGQCLGRTQCSIPVERLHGTCGSEFYNSNYMNITYQCVPVSIVNDFCSKEDNMLDQGYIMSEKYPTKIPGNNLRQCKCVLTAPPAATIAVRAIDFSPYNGTRCQDLQTLTFEEQRKPSSSFSCEHRVDFWMYNSTRNQVNVTFLNTLLGNVGQFWLEYTASSGNVTLNCTEPVGVTTPKPGATTIPTTQKVTQPYRYRNPDESNTPRPTDTGKMIS
ncbi:uncharacterized protein LOC106180142 [Lingula anatina]|uniref:Uncharacterized protein LOC106180142 n=1 Tax=Lingula anatina TaxID=7574 RepID=A0A1S3KB55_LINAN|nr:uncharacterized protein LOC106180142 [Lingula anatina]|eukprot:XP_013419491.2 uncharacterized protein LOC106180142 [Lingula anatina]